MGEVSGLIEFCLSDTLRMKVCQIWERGCVSPFFVYFCGENRQYVGSFSERLLFLEKRDIIFVEKKNCFGVKI